MTAHHERPATYGDRAALDLPAHALAGCFNNVLPLRENDSPVVCFLHQGASQEVPGPLLHAASQTKQLLGGELSRGLHPVNSWATDGQGAGLVEDGDIDTPELFQRGTVAENDSLPRGP